MECILSYSTDLCARSARRTASPSDLRAGRTENQKSNNFKKTDGWGCRIFNRGVMKNKPKNRSHIKAFGAATVEFALVAVTVFTLLFGIIDFSYLFWGTLSMQHAVREGARYAVTGQSNLFANPTGNAKDRCDAAIEEIKNQSMGFYERVSPVIVFSTISTDTPPIITPTPQNSCFNANDIIVISIGCSLAPLTPPIRALFTDGKYGFTVSATMKNEAFK